MKSKEEKGCKGRITSQDAVKSYFERRRKTKTCTATIESCNKQALNRFMATTSRILMPNDIILNTSSSESMKYSIINKDKRKEELNTSDILLKLQSKLSFKEDPDLVESEKELNTRQQKRKENSENLVDDFCIELPSGDLGGRMNTNEELSPAVFDSLFPDETDSEDEENEYLNSFLRK